MNPAFQEDSEEESEMRGGDSTLVARREHVGLQASATARGEASRCPTLYNTGMALHSSGACPNKYLQHRCIYRCCSSGFDNIALENIRFHLVSLVVQNYTL